MDNEYINYIRKAIVETITATDNDELLQYVYTMLMHAVNSRQDSTEIAKSDS